MQYCLLLHIQEVKLENNTHDVYLSLSHKYYDVQYERLECGWSIRINSCDHENMRTLSIILKYFETESNYNSDQ